VAEHNGDDAGFVLKGEDCAKLQIERCNIIHRYICFLQLEDYTAVVRDTERNLTVFDFVEKHAESEDLAWSVQQFRPQLLMIHTRARATESLKGNDYNAAIEQIEDGIGKIRDFFRERGRSEMMDQTGEVHSLKVWLEEITAKRPQHR